MKRIIKGIFKVIGIVFLAVVLVAAGVFGYVMFDNSRVKNTAYTYESEKIPKSFDGYKITVITDFHNSGMYDKVIAAAKKADPDIICIGGDLVNSNDKDFTNTLKLMEGLTEISPVYYSYGNHEQMSKSVFNTDVPPVRKALEDTGVIMLNNRTEILEKDGEKICLTGYGDEIYGDGIEDLGHEHFVRYARGRLGVLSKDIDDETFSVLVMHRAQYFEQMCEGKFDLMLSGHLHGGLINIKPIRDRILKEHFATDEFVKGRYDRDGKTMYVCAGIAREEKIPRVFNTPEIMTIELKSKK